MRTASTGKLFLHAGQVVRSLAEGQRLYETQFVCNPRRFCSTFTDILLLAQTETNSYSWFLRITIFAEHLQKFLTKNRRILVLQIVRTASTGKLFLHAGQVVRSLAEGQRLYETQFVCKLLLCRNNRGEAAKWQPFGTDSFAF